MPGNTKRTNGKHHDKKFLVCIAQEGCVAFLVAPQKLDNITFGAQLLFSTAFLLHIATIRPQSPTLAALQMSFSHSANLVDLCPLG